MENLTIPAREDRLDDVKYSYEDGKNILTILKKI